MATAPIRVVTVDRLPLVHAGVRQMLSTFPDLAVVGEAAHPREVPHLPTLTEGAIILTEVDELGPEWQAAIQRLVRDARKCRVVIFTRDATATRVRQAVRAGVQGYLMKHMQPISLAQALRSIADGQQVFAPEAIRATMLTPLEEPPLTATLSEREREVLTLLAHGLSNQAISTRLCVSRATVKYHCQNVFSKLGVESRTQAVALAYTHNLVPPLRADSDLCGQPL